MKKKLKILAISDTHNMHRRCEKFFPEGDFDIIIHAGDISSRGYQQEVKDFMEWFSGLNQFEHKLMIAGNHDFLFEEKPETAKKLIPENVIYLEDSGVEIEGIKFWGSPQSPWFYDWAFNRQRGNDIKKYWDMIPDDTDIIVAHSPTLYTNDYVQHSNEYVGCEDLRYRVQEIEPVAFICGHIHGAYGKSYNHGTMFYNASLLNESYFPQNKPHVIEIDFDENDKPYINLENES